jgi:hypothetical protein
MDEILASIRRIIESGDERPASATSGAGARQDDGETVIDDGAAAGSSSERRPSFVLPQSEAGVLPLTERITASVGPASEETLEARWLPMDEPANQTIEPVQPAVSGEMSSEAPEPFAEPAVLSDPVEPAEALDRWTREFDDVDTWPVLERKETSVDPDAASQGKPSNVADLSAVEPAVAGRAVDETDDSSAGDDDIDFAMDFNEADFVEALDRNTAFASLRESDERPPLPSNDVLHARAPTAAELSALAAGVVRDPVAAAPAPTSVMGETSALLSDQAGAQVAAAFDDLARAIRDGQMKSMEGMAREMLRPMLQDWLDDNLPRLVERLVREEIERVSRGGRR